MYEYEIEDMLKQNGAALVGFCDLKDQAVAELPELHYAITIAYKLSDSVLKTIEERPSIMYFQHYRIVNTKLDLLSLDTVKFIEDKGYNAFPIAASQSLNTEKDSYKGLFPHKTGATLSGIGFIGKNALLITPEYGSKIRLATVLTDMKLESSKTEDILPGCGECTICSKACPAGAITGKNYKPGSKRESVFDAAKCSTQMKTYTDIGRGAVCGICIKVCPYNKLSK